MRIYINPRNDSKEAFLEREGVLAETSNPELIVLECPDNNVPVVWVDNGPFTAAKIAFDPEALKDFLEPDDPRPKIVYYISIDKAIEGSGCEKLQEYIHGY